MARDGGWPTRFPQTFIQIEAFLYYYIFVSLRAATILGRARCGAGW
jgi:hypothetical protein